MLLCDGFIWIVQEGEQPNLTDRGFAKAGHGRGRIETAQYPEGMTPLIAYYRVSTQRQEQSGLGLEAQARAVLAYANATEGHVLEYFTEVESGRRNDRPELAKAIAAAEALRATLVVAKLDRLTRNAAFLHRLLEAKVDFVACDNPHATKLTIQILAAIAEWEAEAIAKRVRESLAAYTARGGLLGAKDPRCPGFKINVAGRLLGNKRAVQVNREKAVKHRIGFVPIVKTILAEKFTLTATVAELNTKGYRTRRGRPWSVSNLSRCLKWCEGTM